MKTLLIARDRAFWSTGMCRQLFPERIIMSTYAGFLEQMRVAFLGLRKIYSTKPEVLILGTSTKIVSFYTALRRIGFLKHLKIITDKQYLKDRDVRVIDKIIVYSKEEIDQYDVSLRNKFISFYFPSKREDVVLGKSGKSDKFVFCGGNNLRDHNSFVEAIRNTNINAVLVTNKKLDIDIPPNCRVYNGLSLAEYVNKMDNSCFVVVPLYESDLPHGHSDIGIAISLGKPVITTKKAGVESYVEEGEDAICVDPGDVEGYRKAIKLLWEDDDFRQKMIEKAKNNAHKFSYKTFAEKLRYLCEN